MTAGRWLAVAAGLSMASAVAGHVGHGLATGVLIAASVSAAVRAWWLDEWGRRR